MKTKYLKGLSAYREIYESLKVGALAVNSDRVVRFLVPVALFNRIIDEKNSRIISSKF